MSDAALVLYVDIETYWSDDYTLRAMSPFEYATDDRFALHGAAVAADAWIGDRFTSMVDPLWVEPERVAGTLSKAIARGRSLGWPVYFVCHNTLFDAVALTVRGYMPPHDDVVFADTMSLARAHMLHTGMTGGSVSLAACTGGAKTAEVVASTKGLRTADIIRQPGLLKQLQDYCCRDVELTRGLWRRLAPVTPAEELRLIDGIVRATAHPGLRLDVDLLKRHYDTLVEDEQRQLEMTGANKAEVMSSARFAAMLEELGVEVPLKPSPRTGKLIPALSRKDEAFADLVYHPNPLVAELVDLRLRVRSTIERTRAARLLSLAKATPQALLPAPLRYYGAHTGRFSGEWKLNLQNLPRGSALRRAILPLRGQVFVSLDFAQIEARLLAWLAGQDDLVEQFRNREDVYSLFATDVYNVPVSKTENPHLRHTGKVCILSLGYGGGHVPLRSTLNVGVSPDKRTSVDEAKFLVARYRERMSRIVALWRAMGDVIEHLCRYGGGEHVLAALCPAPMRAAGVLSAERHPLTGAPALRLPNGLWLQYHNLRRVADGYVYDAARAPARLYGPKLVENVVQALARIVMTSAALRVRHELPEARLVLSTHDSVTFTVAAGEAQRCLKRITEIMVAPPDWCPDLPLAVDGGVYEALP